MKQRRSPRPPFSPCSEEIGDNVPVRSDSGALTYSVENIKGSFKFLIDIEYGCDISASVAVVRG